MSTIKCMECKDKIWDYLEGALTEAEQQEIKKHLEACEDCAAEAKEIAGIMEGLHGLPLEELPEDYHKELMKKLEQETKIVPFKKKVTHRWKPYSLVAAAVLVVAAVGGVNEIRHYQGDVLTAEKQPVAETKVTLDDTVQNEPKAEIKQQKEPKKENTTPVEKIEAKEIPAATVPKNDQKPQTIQKPSTGDTLTKHASQIQHVMPVQQNTKQMEIQKDAEPKEAALETTDIPMSVNFRMEQEEQAVEKMTLTVQDIKTAMEQLRQIGTTIGAWEENAGKDFIVFSMKADQTAAFYQKVSEIGNAELPEKTAASEEPVFIRVSLQTK